MQQKPDTTPKPPSQSETERELYSEKKAAFLDALECLYIINNQSARSLFREKWPDIAEIIFDPELIRYDYEGVQSDEDRQKRAALEIEADDRREALLAIFTNMESNLVVYGSLQVEELEKIMAQITRPIAQNIFAERFVNRYFPKEQTADGAVSDDLSVSSEKSRGPETYAIRTARSSGHRQPSRSGSENGNSKISASMPSNAVPENLLGSIGHVDHSYKAGTPSYKDPVEGEEEEDIGWLSMSVEEDEFGDVQPISVGNEPHSAPIRPPSPEAENAVPVQVASTAEPERVSAPINPNASQPPQSPQPVDGHAQQAQTPAAQPSPQEPVERVPRLEDLDKHVPPIPGSDDSSGRY